jgi:hypothetical protein
MFPTSGQLVSFADGFEITIDSSSGPSELWIRHIEFDNDEPGGFHRLLDVDPGAGEMTLQVATAPVGTITHLRLFAGSSGSESGGGEPVDELFVARLDPAKREEYLTQCSEGTPLLLVETGGTFVRATIGSGPIESRAQFFVGAARPVWTTGMAFPRFTGDKFIRSALSGPPALLHDVTLVDDRIDGFTSNPRLDAGQDIFAIALAWDLEGGWDFTWTRRAGMPSTPPAAPQTPPPPDRFRTKDRTVVTVVSSMVCLDDSDDLSDGEADFTMTLTPQGGAPIKRTRRWDPMESGSDTTTNVVFDVPGGSGFALVVRGVEDDSDSLSLDSDDVAETPPYRHVYAKGPVTESYREDVTMDSRPGTDGFHFLAHCSTEVSYS